MTREAYIATIRDLISRDPDRIRNANRKLYETLVSSASQNKREADLTLAEIANP